MPDDRIRWAAAARAPGADGDGETSDAMIMGIKYITVRSSDDARARPQDSESGDQPGLCRPAAAAGLSAPSSELGEAAG
eukprot:321612-Hanusia_phi.AAC.1